MKTKECPGCQEDVPYSASRCKHCWHDFHEQPKSNGLVAGLFMMLLSAAGMSVAGIGVLAWLVSQPLDEKILVDGETQSVIWTTRYRTHVSTSRVRWAEVTKVEYAVLRGGVFEIRLVTDDGERVLLKQGNAPMRGDASNFAEKMGKPMEVFDESGGVM